MANSVAELLVLISARDAASSVIAGVGKSLGGFGVAGKVATAALAGIAVAGTGLAGAIGASIGAATTFQHAMSGVGAVAQATGGQLSQLSALALQLGQDNTLAGVSASDAAAAMEQLASGGVSVADILGGAARGALLLASAGGIDFASAATIAAAALKDFNLSGDQTTHVADLFAAAANSSAVTVTSLGESLSYVGPIASSMGISIEEVTAALAELGDKGIKGSEAGTALRTMMANLAKPTAAMKTVMQEYGLQMFDASGKMLSLTGIAGQLHDKLSGLTDQQRAAALATLFGKEALSAATVIYGEGADGLAKYLAEVNVAGSAADNGARRNDNLKGSIEQLKSAWETAQITLGTAFIPVVRQAVDALARLVTLSIPLLATYGPRFAAAIQAGLGQAVAIVRAFGVAVLALVNSLRTGDFSNLFGPLIVAVSTAFGSETAGKVTLFVSKLVTDLNLARDAVLTARQAFSGNWIDADTYIAAPVRIVGEWFTKLGDWVRTAQEWFGKIPAPVLAAAAALLALGPALAVVGAVLPGLIGALTGLGPIISFLGATIPLLGTVIGALGGPITLAIVAIGLLAAAWATNFLGIQTATMPVLTAVGTAITTQLLPALTQMGTFIAATVVPAFQQGWALVQAAVGTAIAAIMPVVRQFSDWFAVNLLPALQNLLAVAVPAFQQMGAAAQGAFQAALPGIQTFIAGVQQLASVVIPILAQVGQVIINSLGPAIMAMVGWAQTVIPQFAAAFTNVMSIVGPVIGQIASVIGTGLSAIAGFISAHSAQITTILTDAWNIISGVIGVVFGVITGIISAGLQAISGDWSGAWETIKQAASTAWDGIQTIVTNAIDLVKNAISVGLDAAKAVATLAWDGIKIAATAAWEGIKTLVSSAIDALKTTISNGLNAARDVAKTALDAMATAATTAMDNLKTAISNGISTAKNTISNGVSGFADIVLGVGPALYSAGAAIIGRLAAGIDSAIGAAVQKVKDGLSQISNLLPHSDPKDPQSPLRGLLESGRAIFTMLGEGIGQGAPEAVKAAADAASAVAKAITDSLAAMKALAGFDFAKNTPTSGQLGGLLAFVRDATAQVAALAAEFADKTLKAAGDFADAAGKVVGLVGNGVKALTDLVKFVPPANASIYAFGKSLRALVNDFAVLSEQVTQDMADEAAAFAESAGKVVAIIGTGVAGFTALVTFLPPPVAAIYAFGKTLRAVVNDFAVLAEQITADMSTEAAAFAEGAGKVVGMIGTGVAAFLALGTYADPGVAAIYAFGKTLRAVVNDFALIAEQVTQDATDQAAKFATGAGAVVGIIGNAVQGFTALLTFVAPSQAAIDNFVYAVYETVRKIAEMASQLSKEGIAQAGAFGVAAGSILGALKTALDVFTGLAKLVVPSALAIDNFGIAVAYTVAKIGSLADQIGKDGIKRAADFGQSIGTIFGSLKSSMDILTNLEKFKDVAAKAFDSLLAGLQGAKDRAEGMVSQAKDLVLLSEEYLANMTKAAANFAKGQSLGTVSGESIGRALGEGVASGAREALDSHSPSQVMAAIGKDVVAGLVQGMDSAQQDAAKKAADVASAVAKAITDTLGAATALGKLDLTTLPTGGQIGGILGFTRALVAEMAAASTMLNEDGTKATSLFADTAGKVASAIGAGVDALTKLGTFVAPASSAIFAFGATLRTAVDDLAVLAEQVTQEMVDTAAQFAEPAAKAVAIFGAGLDGFTKLSTFVRPAASAIYAFDATLRDALNDLGLLAEQVTTGTSDLAGKFADGASKAVGLIANGLAGFTGLATFVRPAATAIYAFDATVRGFINDLALVAEQVTTESADLAGKFADGAGKAVALIANGVAGFKALDGFTGVASANLAAFVRATGDLVKQIVALSTGYAPALLAAASQYADTAGKALALLGNAKAFAALDDFRRPADSSVGAFVATVRDLVKRMVGLGTEFKAEMLKAAGDFADTGGKAVSLVGAAIGGFSGLATFVTPGKAAVDGLLATVRYIIARFGEMAQTMSTEGTKQLGDFGAATNAVLGGVKAAIDTFIALDKAVVPRTGDLSDLVVAVQGVTRNMASAAKLLGDDAIKDATAFGTAASGIFSALKSGLDLFAMIDKPGGWPTTDWLQPLIELMSGMLGRGGQLLTQAQQLKAVADQFAATMAGAYAGFATGLGGGGLTLTGNVGGAGLIGGGGGGTTTVNNYYISGNTLLSKDTATQQMVSGIVTATQGRTIGYATSG